MVMTCPGEPKVETPEAMEVDNHLEAETLLEEMIPVTPIPCLPTVTDLTPLPPIRETSLAAQKDIGARERERIMTSVTKH